MAQSYPVDTGGSVGRSAGRPVGWSVDGGTRYEDAARGTSDRFARCIWGSRTCRDRSDGFTPVRKRVAALPAHPTRSMLGSPVLTSPSRMNGAGTLVGERSPNHQKTLYLPPEGSPPVFFFAMPSIADDVSLEYVLSLSLSLSPGRRRCRLSADTQDPGSSQFRSTLPEPLTKRR